MARSGLRRIHGVLVAGATLAMASMGHADGKVYPGLFCVDKNDSWSSMGIKYSGTYVENTQSNTNTIGCPVVRDWGEPALLEVTVNRNDSTPTEQWHITLWSTSFSGVSGFSETIIVPTVNGVQTLIANSYVNSHTEGGMLHVETVMPAGARIHRYEITEDN